ncbi:MAG: general secretion pathway protein GspL [Sphingomonas sp.]|uniref:type II secretion system protein GspL n=1 Tax=Sphingomonas sp. TaxID=28214 RepID=UPI001ACC03BE|nr:type II secretion system protein GspL [Sphingomonas sp.]MBN8807715.1 general secretion pathway protein GspL [Sphingomonas sp.]
MSDTLALFLPAAPDAPWRWLLARDSALAASGEGLPSPDQPAETRIVAIAPADAVTLHWADLPDRSLAQAIAAARLLVAEASVTPLGDLHVAVGREEGVVASPIGVVANVRMVEWLALLANAGFVARSIIPAPMLLPRPDEGYVVGDLGDGRVLRGTSSGFAEEPGLTDMIVGDAPVATLDRAALEASVAAAVADPALDLRQGAFALQQRAAIEWLLVRRLAWLGAAILCVTLAITLVQILRYNLSASSLEAQADALAEQGLPRGVTVTDAGQQLTDRLTRLRGGGAGFSQTAASVAAAVAAVPGAEVTGMAFDASGRLRVNLAVQSQGQIADVQNRLAAVGFVADAGTFTGSAGRITGVLTVSPR